VRTLVISDLHLGSRLGRDVLRHPEALNQLLAALDDVDRLVLLGDTIELAEGRPQQVMRAAEPVLRAIGARLGPEREVVLVPGNHDAALTQRWTRARGEALTVDAQVPPDATPRLSRVTSWLAPAQIRVHAPGVWLSSRVWATHGHYLDRHLLPESAWGMTRERFGRTAAERVGPSVYEGRRRASRTRVESELVRSLPRPLALLIEDAAELLRAATMPNPRRLPSHRLAPLTARLLGVQMQRASIPALAHVTHRLGVEADWVLFGHVHRAGPLPGDDEALWAGPDRRPRVANTGCWVYEPLVLHGGRPPHPYWPGSGLVVVDEGDPEVVSLLDDVDVAGLFARGRG
jgi:UDP-2,3-diacylglucosamine pyrophosphatase LpxH